SLTPQQAAEERSVLIAIVLDVAISAVFTVTGLLGGSLTMIAETIRVWLMLASGPSLLMQGQLRARVVKLVSSLFVQVTMTVAAVATDEAIVVWADAVGSTFVAVIMLVNALKMLKESLPDLLDQSAGDEVRAVIQRVLAGHTVDAAMVGRVRTRRSG